LSNNQVNLIEINDLANNIVFYPENENQIYFSNSEQLLNSFEYKLINKTDKYTYITRVISSSEIKKEDFKLTGEIEALCLNLQFTDYYIENSYYHESISFNELHFIKKYNTQRYYGRNIGFIKEILEYNNNIYNINLNEIITYDEMLLRIKKSMEIKNEN